MIAQRGFDPRYGARPLQRAIEELIVAPVARWLVEHPGLRDATLRLCAKEERVEIAGQR